MIKNNKIFLIIETLSAPLGRLLISFMFLMSGLNKAGNYSNTSGWMESMGVSSSIYNALHASCRICAVIIVLEFLKLILLKKRH